MARDPELTTPGDRAHERGEDDDVGPSHSPLYLPYPGCIRSARDPVDLDPVGDPAELAGEFGAGRVADHIVVDDECDPFPAHLWGRALLRRYSRDRSSAGWGRSGE